jgi:UDP-N-acetylmuramate: L-alanyl-gamma-D-glutamyl-meso-diaminopimelate ligase
MKQGTMQDRLARSLNGADLVFCYAGEIGWDPAHALAPLGARVSIHEDLDPMVEKLAGTLQPGDHVLVMSNGGFGDVHGKLLERVSAAGRSVCAD